ncbi:MAG TPA: UvrD-helicase domain-containing protein, partial [Candidatus Krumholzibacteria bacterium]|nr:UvrD-helicase domain-containing protein [Candidatus Krumholzibacteria bacterium]
MNREPDRRNESSAEASRTADALARREAQSSFDLPFVLEAGAGTGKTTALIARIISWIMGPGWDKSRARLDKGNSDTSEEDLAASVLDSVVAITFTEAAAAEMETRTGQVLASLSRGETPHFLVPDQLPEQSEARASRAAQLLTNLDHLQVHTIHAWCSRILARFPLEAGLHPDFQVDADGSLRREAAQDIVEEHLHSAYRGDLDPALSALAQDGKGPKDLADALTTLVELDVRSDELQNSPFAEEELRNFNARVLEILAQLPEELLLSLEKIPRNKNTGCFSRWMIAARTALGAEAPRSRAGLERFLEKMLNEDLDGARTKLTQWKTGKFNKGELDAIDDPERSLLTMAAPSLLELTAGLQKLRPSLLEAALHTLAPLLAAVENRLHAHGILSYEDLLSRTRDLLRASPQVCALLRREIDQILVDEFQDTNDLQCEIIHSLALRGDPAQRPGLFLVGDPKQSIYGWRGADLSAYDRFVSQLEELGTPRRRLSVNFRSVPQILDEVNRTIAPIMQSEKELQPPYQFLLPSPSNLEKSGYHSPQRRPVEHWVSGLPRGLKDASLRSGESTALEARGLAADLSALAREAGPGFRWSSVGILFRSGGDLEIYLAELRRAHIPYSVERDRQYFRRREILDATALLAAVVEPADHLSLLTFLRSAWVGVPDAALLGLWRREFPRAMTLLHSPEET